MVATKRQRRGRQKQKIRKTAKVHQAYPHDSFFKKIFKRPKYCRALMEIILQPKLYAIFNWALMKISESVSTGTKGAERRADIVLEVPLLNEKHSVIITIILEHKSYRDNNAILQMLSYYNEAAQETHNLILPIIITCCKDKKASIPSDYISWALQQQGAPAALKEVLRPLPNFGCPLVNLHSLSSRRMQQGGEAEERESGQKPSQAWHCSECVTTGIWTMMLWARLLTKHNMISVRTGLENLKRARKRAIQKA